MLLVLTTVAALAGGGGVMVEFGPGGTWNNATGPIVRGGSVGGSVGAFWGPYQSTLQYGRYTRAGLRVNGFAARPFSGGIESGVVSIGPEIGAGIDLLRVGAFWRVSAEIAGFYPDINAATIKTGMVVRAAGAGVWWPTRNFGVLLRAELATNQPFTEELDTSFSAGLGFGILFRAGAVRSEQPEWAESDLSLDGIPMEEVEDPVEEGQPD